MKSKRVTSTWEFYRDNCEGFKEPMRKELRKLDDYVANIEDENARLRELVRNVEHYERFGCQGCPNARGCTAPMLYDERCSMRQKIDNDKRELGIEVDA